MYYVCHDHKVAYPRGRQLNGHKRKTLNETSNECNAEEVEELPDGYDLKPEPKSQPWAGEKPDSSGGNGSGDLEDTVVDTPARRPAGDRAPVASATATLPESYDDDPRARELNRQLTAVGVPPKEVVTIVNGFMGMDAFSADPNYLHRWLETNIRNKLLHSYIPMIVNELFQLQATGTNAPMYPNPQAPQYASYPQQRAGYGAPAYNAAGQQPHPGWEQPPYWVQWLIPKERETTEPSAENKAVMEQLKGLQTRLDESEAERKKERAEQEENARARLIQGRFAQLEERLVKLTEAIAAGPSDTKTSDMAELRAEMREMGNRVTDAQFDKLELMIQNLNDRMMSGAEPVGRTTEDVVSTVGPLLLDKLDAAGKRIIQEVKEAREHALPSASDRRVIEAEPQAKPEPLTVDEIVELAEAENAVLDLADDLRHGPPVPVAEEPAEPPGEASEAGEQAPPSEGGTMTVVPFDGATAVEVPAPVAEQGDEQGDSISGDPEATGPGGADHPTGDRDHERSLAATGSRAGESDAGGGAQGN